MCFQTSLHLKKSGNEWNPLMGWIWLFFAEQLLRPLTMFTKLNKWTFDPIPRYSVTPICFYTCFPNVFAEFEPSFLLNPPPHSPPPPACDGVDVDAVVDTEDGFDVDSRSLLKFKKKIIEVSSKLAGFFWAIVGLWYTLWCYLFDYAM